MNRYKSHCSLINKSRRFSTYLIHDETLEPIRKNWETRAYLEDIRLFGRVKYQQKEEKKMFSSKRPKQQQPLGHAFIIEKVSGMRYFPFKYTLGISAITFPVALLLYHLLPSSDAVRVVSVILLWASSLVVLVLVGVFIRDWITDRLFGWEAVVKWFDCYLAGFIAIANGWMALYILDSSPTKNFAFVFTGDPGEGYVVYVRFLFTAITVFNSAGFSNTFANSVAAQLVGIVTSMWGTFFITFPFAYEFKRRVEQNSTNRYNDVPFGRMPGSVLNQRKKKPKTSLKAMQSEGNLFRGERPRTASLNRRRDFRSSFQLKKNGKFLHRRSIKDNDNNDVDSDGDDALRDLKEKRQRPPELKITSSNVNSLLFVEDAITGKFTRAYTGTENG